MLYYYLKKIDLFDKNVHLRINRQHSLNTLEGVSCSVIFYFLCATILIYNLLGTYSDNEPIIKGTELIRDLSVMEEVPYGAFELGIGYYYFDDKKYTLKLLKNLNETEYVQSSYLVNTYIQYTPTFNYERNVSGIMGQCNKTFFDEVYAVTNMDCYQFQDDTFFIGGSAFETGSERRMESITSYPVCEFGQIFKTDDTSDEALIPEKSVCDDGGYPTSAIIGFAYSSDFIDIYKESGFKTHNLTTYENFDYRYRSLYVEFKLTKSYMETDPNYLYNFNSKRLVTFYETNVEMKYVEKPEMNYDLSLEVRFSMDFKEKKTYRSYNKVDTILADSFSMIEVLFIIFEMFVHIMTKRAVEFEIINQMYYSTPKQPKNIVVEGIDSQGRRLSLVKNNFNSLRNNSLIPNNNNHQYNNVVNDRIIEDKNENYSVNSSSISRNANDVVSMYKLEENNDSYISSPNNNEMINSSNNLGQVIIKKKSNISNSNTNNNRIIVDKTFEIPNDDGSRILEKKNSIINNDNELARSSNSKSQLNSKTSKTIINNFQEMSLPPKVKIKDNLNINNLNNTIKPFDEINNNTHNKSPNDLNSGRLTLLDNPYSTNTELMPNNNINNNNVLKKNSLNFEGANINIIINNDKRKGSNYNNNINNNNNNEDFMNQLHPDLVKSHKNYFANKNSITINPLDGQIDKINNDKNTIKRLNYHTGCVTFFLDKCFSKYSKKIKHNTISQRKAVEIAHREIDIIVILKKLIEMEFLTKQFYMENNYNDGRRNSSLNYDNAFYYTNRNVSNAEDIFFTMDYKYFGSNAAFYSRTAKPNLQDRGSLAG